MEIRTNKKLNETVKETLKMRGDNMSLYALKRIEELEQLALLRVVGRSEQLKCNHDLYRSGNYIKCRNKDCNYEILG